MLAFKNDLLKLSRAIFRFVRLLFPICISLVNIFLLISLRLEKLLLFTLILPILSLIVSMYVLSFSNANKGTIKILYEYLQSRNGNVFSHDPLFLINEKNEIEEYTSSIFF